MNIQQNPFDGSQTLPIREQGKTAVIGGTIWKLVVFGPGASGWEDTGIAAVPADWAPPTAGSIPAALVEHVKNASPTDYDSVKARSAMSVSITNANHNQGVYDIACSKYVTHQQTGQGKMPPHPSGFYRIADFNTLFQMTMAGIDTSAFNPPEYPSR